MLNQTGSYLYADDTCICYQHKHFEKTKKVLNKDFSPPSERFRDNKLSVHFGAELLKR